MDNLNTGQLSRHFFFWQVTSLRGRTWDPNTPRRWIFWTMIFYILKKIESGVKLYFEFTKNWSLSCSKIAIFWQITRNHRFWLLTTFSEYIWQDCEFVKFYIRLLMVLRNFNALTFGMPKKVWKYLLSFNIKRVKRAASCVQFKSSSSVHL